MQTQRVLSTPEQKQKKIREKHGMVGGGGGRQWE